MKLYKLPCTEYNYTNDPLCTDRVNLIMICEPLPLNASDRNPKWVEPLSLEASDRDL